MNFCNKKLFVFNYIIIFTNTAPSNLYSTFQHLPAVGVICDKLRT